MELKVLKTEIRQRSSSRVKTARSMYKAPRVYVWPYGESVLDNLINRKSRPIKLFRQLALEGLKSEGIQVQKMRWSQYAGCSCPCSPGFILDEYAVTKEGAPTWAFDAHISVGAADA